MRSRSHNKPGLWVACGLLALVVGAVVIPLLRPAPKGARYYNPGQAKAPARVTKNPKNPSPEGALQEHESSCHCRGSRIRSLCRQSLARLSLNRGLTVRTKELASIEKNLSRRQQALTVVARFIKLFGRQRHG